MSTYAKKAKKVHDSVSRIRGVLGVAAQSSAVRAFSSKTGIVLRTGATVSVVGLVASPIIACCVSYLESDFVKWARRIAEGGRGLEKAEQNFDLQLRKAEYTKKWNPESHNGIGWSGLTTGAAVRKAYEEYAKQLEHMGDALTNIVRRHDRLILAEKAVNVQWTELRSQAMRSHIAECEKTLNELRREWKR